MIKIKKAQALLKIHTITLQSTDYLGRTEDALSMELKASQSQGSSRVRF